MTDLTPSFEEFYYEFRAGTKVPDFVDLHANLWHVTGGLVVAWTPRGDTEHAERRLRREAFFPALSNFIIRHDVDLSVVEAFRTGNADITSGRNDFDAIYKIVSPVLVIDQVRDYQAKFEALRTPDVTGHQEVFRRSPRNQIG